MRVQVKAAAALLLGCAGLLAGCGSTTGGSSHVSVYGGAGHYDSWGWGPCCYNAGVVGPAVAVDPRPPTASQPRPAQPIAEPPTAAAKPPMASPRPAARGGGRR